MTINEIVILAFASWMLFCLIAGPVIALRYRSRYWKAYHEQRRMWKTGFISKSREDGK